LPGRKRCGKIKLMRILFLFIFLVSVLKVAFASGTREVCFKNFCLNAEVAASEEEKSRGLMFRDSLAVDQGMLFIFDNEYQPSFWMKNMRFPLDIIWINSEKKVVDITRNVPACRDECAGFTPKARVKYVLEINAGLAQKYAIEIGDTLTFQDWVL
jgi:uncharacterized membrane protein (UPF0127 family)